MFLDFCYQLCVYQLFWGTTIIIKIYNLIKIALGYIQSIGIIIGFMVYDCIILYKSDKLMRYQLCIRNIVARFDTVLNCADIPHPESSEKIFLL